MSEDGKILPFRRSRVTEPPYRRLVVDISQNASESLDRLSADEDLNASTAVSLAVQILDWLDVSGKKALEGTITSVVWIMLGDGRVSITVHPE